MTTQAAPSPLMQLLSDTKEEHRDLVKSRNYQQAKNVRQQCFTSAAKEKERMHTEVAARHETERRRLAMAKKIALEQVHTRVAEELAEIEAQWQEKKDAHDRRQEQRFIMYERQVRAREDSKPVVLSSYVRDLQQSEKQLASFHMYDDADVVRRKISKKEIEEREMKMDEAEKRIQKCLELRREQMADEESSFRAKVKNEIQLAKFRATMEEQRVMRQFEHVERDMAHAHALELRQNPLTQCYQRPAFIKSQQQLAVLAQKKKKTNKKDRDDTIIASEETHNAAAVTRGSEYLKRTQGSKFEVPSLCDLYLGTSSSSSPTTSSTTTGGFATTTATNNGGSPSQQQRHNQLAPLQSTGGSGNQQQQQFGRTM